MRSAFAGIVLSCLLWLMPGSLQAQVYNLGKSETVVLGIGRDGTLVGQLDLFNGFVKRPGHEVEIIQYPGAIATGITGINADCLLGSFTSGFSLDVVGFKECKGKNTILYGFGLTFTTAMRDDGTVVGYYSTDSGRLWSGFIQKGEDAMQPYNVPGASSTRIFAIDDVGQIAGDFNDAQGQHGFVWDGKVLQKIDFAHLDTTVTGINCHCILGVATLKDGNQEGFVRCKDDPKDDIPVRVGISSFPRAFLPDGTIAGFFFDNTLQTNLGFELRKFANVDKDEDEQDK